MGVTSRVFRRARLFVRAPCSPLVMANAGQDNRLFNQNDKEMRRLRDLATGTPPLAMENHVSGVRHCERPSWDTYIAVDFVARAVSVARFD